MKKLTLSLFALASICAVCAQGSIIKYDFEDGQNNDIKAWDKKPIEILDSKQAAGGSKHAIKVTSASYFATGQIKEKGTYEYSIDSKYIWGKAGELKIFLHNKDTKQMDLVTTQSIAEGNTYQKTAVKFKVKDGGGYYRFIISPSSQGGGNLVVDNVTVKKIK